MRSANKHRQGTKRNTWTDQALEKLLRETLAHGFPNPQRIGCPPPEALERNAEDPIHADASVSRHLAHCSPCYRAYARLLRRQLAQMRRKSTPPMAKRRAKRPSRKKV